MLRQSTQKVQFFEAGRQPSRVVIQHLFVFGVSNLLSGLLSRDLSEGPGIQTDHPGDDFRLQIVRFGPGSQDGLIFSNWPNLRGRTSRSNQLVETQRSLILVENGVEWIEAIGLLPARLALRCFRHPCPNVELGSEGLLQLLLQPLCPGRCFVRQLGWETGYHE